MDNLVKTLEIDSTIHKTIQFSLSPTDAYTISENGMFLLSFAHSNGAYEQSICALVVFTSHASSDNWIAPNYLFGSNGSPASIEYNPYRRQIRRTIQDVNLNALRYFAIKIATR